MKKHRCVNFTLALLFFINGGFSYAQSNNKIDSLKQVLRDSGEDTARVNTLNQLAFELCDLDPNLAMQYGNEAMQLAGKLSYKDGKANACNVFGTVYRRQGDYDKALENHLKALDIQNETGDKEGQAISFTNIGAVYLDQGNYDKALEYQQKALSIEGEKGDKKRISASYYNMGMAYEHQGSYDKAVEYYLKSLRLDEETGNKKGIADCYNMIGITYDDQGKYDMALEYYQKSLSLKQESKDDKKGVAYSLTNIGNIYNKQGNYEKTLEYYFKALPMLEAIGDVKSEALLLGNIGTVYYFQSNYSKTLEYFQQSLSMHEKINDKEGIVISTVNIGQVYTDMKNYPQSIQYLNRGVDLAKETGAKNYLKEAYSGLSITYSKMNDYKKAFEYQQLFSDLKDTLLNESTNRQIAEFHTKYETEKKDKEITQLNFEKIKTKNKQDIILLSGGILIVSGSIIVVLIFNRRKTNHRFQLNQMENKALRAQLNPHFISNSFISIRNFIHDNNDAAEKYLDKFSKMMRSVLENSERESISLAEELNMARAFMEFESLRLKHGFNYEISVDSSVDEEAVRVPPLILQPVIENAVKYGLSDRPQKGSITVRTLLKDHFIECSVENYCGIMPEDSILKEKENPGRKSKGLQVTKERLALLTKSRKRKGSIELFPNDYGMKVVLKIPV